MTAAMTRSAEIYRAIQARARSDAARTGKPVATGEYLTRHALESFLFRVTQTAHADAFVLKGGILLTAYDVRRPTKDLDAEAISASVTPAHISRVVHDAAAVDAGDGIVFDLDSISVQQIRDDAEYPGLRMRAPVTLAELRRAAESVARYRGVELGPISPVIAGYGDIGQGKWAAWRRKEGFQEISEENLDDQMGLVAAVLDPVFRR